MDMSKKIKQICVEKGIKLGELGSQLDYQHPTTFYVKLHKGIVKLEDAERILDKLDCELAVVDRKTKKVY